MFCKKCISYIVVVLVLFGLFAPSVYAAGDVPYTSYRVWEGMGTAYSIAARDLYEPLMCIQTEKFGIGAMDTPRDLYVHDGEIYILDSNNSRIVVLNSDYSLNHVVDHFTDNGETLLFTDAQGIMVAENGDLYIADTENKRVLHTDKNGVLKRTYTRPVSEVFPEDLDFKPIKLVLNEYGYLFVVCDGCYYGALVFDPQGNFCNFYGANTTASGLLSSLERVFQNLFVSDIKQSWSQRALPYCFDDIAYRNGFIYTATASNEGGGGQVRKLSYSGQNVLKKGEKSSDNINFSTFSSVELETGLYERELLQALAVDERDYLYLLDRTYGHILVYTAECQLITVIGGGHGSGEQVGTFQMACEIAVTDTDILVLDDATGFLTVYRRNELGDIVFNALSLDRQGKYDEAFPLWQTVLKKDSFTQIAYAGIAKYHTLHNNYEQAMEYARKGYDRDVYENAFKEYRRIYLQEHLIYIFIGALVLLALLITWHFYRKKYPKTLMPKQKVRILTKGWLHPFSYFTEMKEKKLAVGAGQVTLLVPSIGIFLVWFVVSVLQVTKGGFMYTQYNPSTFNAWITLLSTGGVALLWCTCNWGACTLLEGKGNFCEIAVITSQALIPQIIYGIFYLIGSQVIVYSEQWVFSIGTTISWIATLAVLLIGMCVIHEYSFFRSLAMGIVTVVGMLLVIFVLLMLLTLFRDLFGFFYSIATEWFYRYKG